MIVDVKPISKISDKDWFLRGITKLYFYQILTDMIRHKNIIYRIASVLSKSNNFRNFSKLILKSFMESYQKIALFYIILGSQRRGGVKYGQSSTPLIHLQYMHVV